MIGKYSKNATAINMTGEQSLVISNVIIGYFSKIDRFPRKLNPQLAS